MTYFCPPGADCVGIFTTKIYLDNSILLFPPHFVAFLAYFVACLIIFAYDKLKAKKQ